MARTATDAVLTVDVGNTVTRFGIFTVGSGTPRIAGACELGTGARFTADDAYLQLTHALSILPDIELDGAILSCVVPALEASWQRALTRISPTRPLVVGPGLKTGVKMLYDDPSEVGSDRVADIVAARDTYHAPTVVVDLGTTTNFEVIDATGAFAGGVIAPGVALGARALTEAAARLPMIELKAPRSVIGKNTRAAMQSGVVLGEVARIDGLLDAIMAELGEVAQLVITGDAADAMATLLRHDAAVDPTLTLRGLALLWQRNRRTR